MDSKTSLLFNKWKPEEKEAIQGFKAFLDEVNYKDIKEDVIDKETKDDIFSKLHAHVDKSKCQKLQELIDNNRNDLLIEILRPFETGNIGTRTATPKLDLLKETNDKTYTISQLEGRIYDFEQTENGVHITFSITNERMNKFDKLYVLSNFIYDEYRKAYIPNLEKKSDEKTIIDDLYYPYEYFFEADVSLEKAKEWLSFCDNRFYIDEINNHFELNIRDLGIMDASIYDYLKQTKPENTDNDNKETTELDKILNRLQDSINKPDIGKFENNIGNIEIEAQKRFYTEAINRLTDYNLGLGTPRFIDDDTTRKAVGKATRSSSQNAFSRIEGNAQDEKCLNKQLNELFNGYEKSEITIYKVALGNCVAIKISYKKSLNKKANLLIFDAGINDKHDEEYDINSKNIIEETSETLLSEIRNFEGKVYFIISHYHRDHYNIINRLLYKTRELDQTQIPEMHCILNYCNQNVSGALRQQIYMLAYFRSNCLIVPDSKNTFYSKESIKVLQGKANPKLSAFEQENQRSLMIQLRNTLLPGDSYYRYWHDEFGKIYGLDVNNESKLMYKKFKYILAPHHGWINAPGIDNEAVEIKEAKNIVDGVYEKNAKDDKDNTDVYVLRHDEGSGNPPITSDLMKSLGIDTDKHYFITEYKSGDKYSFTDQWDFTTMSDEEIVDECIWALKNTPRVDENIGVYLNNQHQHCTCAYGLADNDEIDYKVFFNQFIVYFNNTAIDDLKDISYYFNYAKYYNIKCSSLCPSGKCNIQHKYKFESDARNLAKSKIEFSTNSKEKATNIYRIFYELLSRKEFPYNNSTFINLPAFDIKNRIEATFCYSDKKGINLNHSYNAVEITENNSIYTIKIRLVQNWSDAYERSTP